MRRGQTIARQARKTLAAADRRREVFRLWTSDDEIGFREIGKTLGVSHEQARQDLKAFIEERKAEDDQTVEDWKRKQLARLNRKYVRLEAIASGEALKNQRRMTAARKIELRLKAEAEQIKVLREIADVTGIKAAQKHEHSGPDGKPLNVVTQVVVEFTHVKEDQ